MELEEQKEYYLTTKEKSYDVIYKSEPFKLTELEIINLIKICFVQKRAVGTGKKILAVYKDSTSHKEEKVKEILKKIGIEEKNGKSTRAKNSRIK